MTKENEILFEKIAELQAQIKNLESKLKNQMYKGFTVEFIYDKLEYWREVVTDCCKVLTEHGIKTEPISVIPLSETIDRALKDLKSKKEPIFKHDCSVCVWLGTIYDSAAGRKLDIYYHHKSDGLIYRYGDDGPDYTAIPFDYLRHELKIHHNDRALWKWEGYDLYLSYCKTVQKYMVQE